MTRDLAAYVFGDAEPWLTARTLRALERVGVDARPRARGPTWFVRAGAVPTEVPRRPPPSATGRPMAFLGATKGDPAWKRLLRTTGGALPTTFDARIDSVYLDDPTGFDGSALPDHVRAVRWPHFDVALDPRLAIVEVITSLHRGGPARVVLELVAELRASGHDVVLAVLDEPTRSTFDEPAETLHVYEMAQGRASRVHLLADMAIQNGADLIHAHLLDGEEMRLLARSGIPLVASVHNSRQGWPTRTKEGLDAASLVIAPSCDVTDQLFAARPPVRTIWPGITPRKPLPYVAQKKRTVLTVANHRPQKRLDRIPPVIAALGDARAVIVGEPVKKDGTIAAEVLKDGVRLGVEIALVGSKPNVMEALAETDVMLTTSDYEGFSISQLEAMAAEVPLVTTAVSGTREIAAKHEGVTIVVDPTTDALADAIRNATSEPTGLAPDFTAAKMAERHADLLRRVARLRSVERSGVLLVTRDLAMRGSSVSARALLEALASRSVSVRGVVLDEPRDHGTPNRAALLRAGIEIHAAPRGADAMIVARDVCAFVDRVEPEAILLWDVSPEIKIALADLLVGRAVWDVSEGPTFFEAFDRYFEHPRIASPYLRARDYGRLLAGAIVKYESEKARMDDALGVRVHVIPDGVVVPPRPLRRRPDGKPVIGALTRLAPERRVDLLIDAAKEIQNAEVRIAGPVVDPVYLEQLRERAKGTPVVFVGEQDPTKLLAEIDVFASVSEPGGASLALLEAMAAGLPVVATDHGAARDQLTHGETGLVVPRSDARAFGTALADIAFDRERRMRFGDRAHERARERYGVGRMADAYVRLLVSELAEQRVGA